MGSELELLIISQVMSVLLFGDSAWKSKGVKYIRVPLHVCGPWISRIRMTRELVRNAC